MVRAGTQRIMLSINEAPHCILRTREPGMCQGVPSFSIYIQRNIYIYTYRGGATLCIHRHACQQAIRIYIYIHIKNSYYHIPGMKPHRSPQYRNMYIYISKWNHIIICICIHAYIHSILLHTRNLIYIYT